MHRVELTVRGRVQGVGFRGFVARRARDLALAGEVRNTLEGTVEVAAEGGLAALESFVAEVRRGPVGARVDEVDVAWHEGTGRYRGFDIRG